LPLMSIKINLTWFNVWFSIPEINKHAIKK
jgi:hypothetical protein